jgi:hypothetical protein
VIRRHVRSVAKVAVELEIRPPLLYRWAHMERVPDVFVKLESDL